MKKFCFLFLTVAATGFSALPPLHQSTRELQALLADSHMSDLLGSAEPIKDIVRTEGGYLILTQNYAMRVDVLYGGFKQIAGPIQFELAFHRPVNLQTGEIKFSPISEPWN